MDSCLCLRGKIFSGNGEGEKFITLPWVRKQIVEKIGFDPYPGTLNIKLENDIKLRTLNKAKAIEISPETGFYRGICFKACFMDKVECAIVIPEIANYPKNILEVIAPINLKENLLLKNGNTVKIKITL